MDKFTKPNFINVINSILPRDSMQQEIEHVPLVVSMRIGSCTIYNILVDTISVANVLFRHAFKQMSLYPMRVTPYEIPLIGFAG